MLRILKSIAAYEPRNSSSLLKNLILETHAKIVRLYENDKVHNYEVNKKIGIITENPFEYDNKKLNKVIKDFLNPDEIFEDNNNEKKLSIKLARLIQKEKPFPQHNNRAAYVVLRYFAHGGSPVLPHETTLIPDALLETKEDYLRNVI